MIYGKPYHFHGKSSFEEFDDKIKIIRLNLAITLKLLCVNILV